MDFDFQNITDGMPFFNFNISAGSTRNFPLTIIDDSVAEYHHKYIYYFIGIHDFVSMLKSLLKIMMVGTRYL